MTGIQETPFGFRAYVRVRGFPLQSRRFPKGTSADAMQQWRALTRAKLVIRREEPKEDDPPLGSFRAAVRDYLPQVSTMPSYKERVRDLGYWLAVFGDEPITAITPTRIRAQRNAWLTTGPRRVQRKVQGVVRWVETEKPLAPGTVNHRIRALSNVFTVLWPRAYNPVRDVEEAPRGQEVPRSVPFQVVKIVLAAMSDRGYAPKDTAREDFSASKVRASCLAWSGITPKELGRMQPEQNRWREDIIVVTSRQKGQGSPGRFIPLTPEGRAAFRELEQRELYGPFNVGVVNRALGKACAIAKVPRITCYTFRHSYITGVLDATHNLDLVRMLAGHKDARTTRVYQSTAELGALKAGISTFKKWVKKRPKLPHKSPHGVSANK